MFQKAAPIWRHCVDVLASLAVEAFVILVWHGVWMFTDHYVEEIGMDTVTSAWISLVRIILPQATVKLLSLLIQATGALISLILLLLQFPLNDLYLSGQYSMAAKMSANAVFAVCGGFGGIQSFRAVWYLLDAYFLPGTRLKSFPCPQLSLPFLRYL